MELPFLKNKKNRLPGGSSVERNSDQSTHAKYLTLAADELLDAFEKKDRVGFRQALQAFLYLLQNEDADEQ